MADPLAALARIDPPPNLVLVVVDTLRADRMSVYGHPDDTTPELCAWAEQGVLFERVRSQSSWTKVSMASILTSLWPHTHRVRRSTDGLAPSALSVAEVLHAAGYATYGVQSNGWLDQSFGFHQGFDRYVFPTGGGARRVRHASLWPHADRVLDEARRLVANHDYEMPFFLYLHFMDVHEYAAPPGYQRFGDGTDGAYLAAIAWVDDALRRLIEALEDADQAHRTVVVLTSDHAEAFGENGVHGHARNSLSTALSVPLVIRWPFPAVPARIPRQVRSLDVAPTLLELARVRVPPSFEGTSLLPPIRGSPEPADRISYASLRQRLYPDATLQDSVTDGDWTFARAYDERGEVVRELLFDLTVDPREDVDLLRREPAQADRLRRLLDETTRTSNGDGVRSPGVRIDPGIARRLRAMGYLQSTSELR